MPESSSADFSRCGVIGAKRNGRKSTDELVLLGTVRRDVKHEHVLVDVHEPADVASASRMLVRLAIG